MQSNVITTSIFAHRTQSNEARRAAEMSVLVGEFARLAENEGPSGALKMVLGAWIAATTGMDIRQNNEVATLLEGLAARFR
jgi:hypothetical protein